MQFNSFLSFQGLTERLFNRFIYTLILAASGVLLTACVSSSGGGGGGAAAPSAPSRVGVFSHAAYDFVLLNTTQAGRNQSPVGERRLGLIHVEEAEIRARLPAGAVWQPDDVRYTIVGGANDLTRAFFKLDRAALLFEAAPRYASRTFTLDYVVNTLGIDALRVVANVSYVDAQGARQTLGLYEVPVTMRAVAEVPAANDFVVFDGIRRSGTEQRDSMVTTTMPDQSFQGRLSQTMNLLNRMGAARALAPFTDSWVARHYTPDADEVRRADTNTVAAFDGTQLITSAAPRQTRPALAVTVTLTLNNNSDTQVSGRYAIAAGTNISVVNGNSSVDGSFLAFLQGLNATDNNPPFDFVALDANDRVGLNVTEMAWSFTFPYTADVTTTTTSTRTVRVSRLAYTAEGAIDENVAGRTSLSRSAEILRTLGIRLNRPAGFEGPLPTLYFQVANANVSEAHCETAFYLDQGYRHYQNYQIKAQASPDAARPLLNHEARDAYACQMEVSLRGTDSSYRAITTGNLTDTNNQTTAVAGTAVDLNVVTCGSANATTRLQALRTAPGCIYRADVDIAVRDRNEPVEFNFEVGVMDALDEANVGLAEAQDMSVGTPLNTSASDPVLATFTYREPDQNAAGVRLDVDVPRIMGVVPARVVPTGRVGSVDTAGLFYIEPRAADQAALRLNASVAADVLDYEALATNATGQRGLRVTIQATDNSTARLVTERVFNLEVQDVVYKPIDLAYTPQVDSFNRSLVSDPVVQLLLPGFAQFVANGGPVLGRMQAVDPETNTSAGLSYAYVGVAPLSADPAVLQQVPLWNASFTLGQHPRRPTADELLLVGVGLRAGADFHVQLQARNESPRANVTGDVVPVRTMVAYDAVPPGEAYGGEPPIKFNTGTFLGFVAEGVTGAEVYNSTGQPRTKLGNLLVAPADDNRSFSIMTQAEIAPLVSGLGPLTLDVQRALASRLAVLSGPEQFNLNQSTGALSLRAAADFTTQPVHMLLLRVADRRVPVPAAYRVSDYALVQVVVEDTNTAPALMNLRAVHETVSTTSSLVRLNDLPEDTPAGTVLATLQVRDDNPLTGVNFVPAQGATVYKIERTAASRRIDATASEAAHYLASYRLVTVAPDYEANATLDVVHELVDNGRYGYDPLRQMVVRSAPSLVNTTMLRVNASVVDVNEAPVVRFMQSRVNVAENADQGDAVVTVRAEDPEGLVANLTYTLTTVPGSLAAAFNVTEVGATVTNEGRVATWALEVADAAALENAGDGQIFTLTLTATDLRGASTSVPLVITVLDVPSVLDVTAVNTTLLELSEQQALDDPDRVLRAPLFRLADVQSDYDEYFFGLGPNDPGPAVRFGELAFAPGMISYVDARGMSNATITDGLHNEERFNLFTLQEENAAVNLVLGEAGLIEPHLLGRHVRLEVRLRDPAGTATPQTVQVPVAIVPTQPEGLRFVDGQNLDASLVPAVYTFKYDQTAYVDHLADGACRPDNATQLTYDGRCYPTEQVRVDANSAPVLYVRRDVAKQEVLDAPATVLSVNNTFSIVLTETAGLTADAIAIYTLDDEGNLAEATAAFATYFTYRVNTSYAANRTALLIEQKRHAVLYANGSGVNPNAHYAALDTLPLDSREDNQQRVLSFFFVAGDGATNASRRAIAQMNVEVKSAGLNVRARVAELRLGEIFFPVDPEPNKRISFAENGAGAVGFPVNVVNNLDDVLTMTIENPDSAERNQTVRATVDVVVADTDTNDPATAGMLDVSAGMATGNALVRLGSNADAQQRLTIGLGVRNATGDLLFQLARNVHGSAYIRVRFEERDDQNRLVEDDPYYEYFLLEVTRVDEVASRITDIRVADASSPVDEDGFGTASPQLNITLTNEQFRSPRDLDLIDIAVASSPSQYAGLVVDPDERAEVVVPVGRINVQHVLQDLDYTMHAHGTTTFTVRAGARERRGFTDVLHTYDERSFTRAFRVTAINDPLLPSPRAETATRYVLQTQFDEGNRLNQFVEGIDNAVVFATDVDLATNGSVPANPMFTFATQPLGNSSTMLHPSDVRVPDAAVRLTTDGTDVRVAFPVELRLSQAQYDAILLQEGGFDLNMTVVLRDGDDATVVVNITKPLIRFSVSTDDAILASVGGYVGAINVDEATAAGEELPLAAINITDPDIQRASGDVFTYGLNVTRTRDGAAVSDLLAWRDVDDRQAATAARRLTRRASASFLSALQLAKTPQDADVGQYEVNWTISEAQSATGFPRSIANGTLLVHIVNLNDALAVAATPAPTASAYHLQQDFGVRTLAGRGMQLRADKVVRASFTDDDLLLASAAGQLPTVDDISIVGTTVLAGAPVQVGIDARNASGVDVRAAGGNRLQVTVPVNVTLTPDQYDAINRDGTASIAFTLMVRDGNTTVGPRPAANASASFAVMAGPNNVILDEKIEEGALVQIPTTTPQNTQVGANFVLNDPEIRRNSGERITTAISSDHANLATNILEWVDLFGVRREITTVRGRMQDTLTLLLRTSRALTDAAHAGFYNVSWSLDDDEVQLGSHFRLNVTDVNDPLVAASVANATYSLRADFDAAGNLTAAIQDLEFFFTDADLATAGSTATRGGAASTSNVLDPRPEFGALTSSHINGTVVPNLPTPETRLVFGLPNVTHAGADTIRVAVPVNLNLTQVQYDALLGTGGQNFHMHVTLDNRDVYGTTDGTTTSRTATLVLRDFGTAARALIPANTYDGGDVTIYREQARLAHTLGAGAVFLNGTHQPQRINITDADFQSTSGDTYMYHLNVTDSSTGARIMNLLEWDASAPTENIQQSSPNVLRVLRYQNRALTDLHGPQPGVYTVAWSITEARGGTTLNRQVVNGTFALTIQETPAPQLQPIANQLVMEGRTDQLNITLAFVEAVPGDITVDISHTPAFASGRSIVLPGRVSRFTGSLDARDGRVGFNTNASFLITGALDDPDVRTYRLNVTASTTDVDGSVQAHTVLFNLTVANVNDLTLGISRSIADYIAVTIEGQFSIGDTDSTDASIRRIRFEDDDLRIPGTARLELTAFDSNFKLGFTADGGNTSGVCEIERDERPVTNVVSSAGSRQVDFSVSGLSLTDCRSDDIPAGINDLYELSQNRTVHLLNVTIDDYAEFVGPTNQVYVNEIGRSGGMFGSPYEIPHFIPYIDITTSAALAANLTTAPDGIYRLAANLNLTSWTPISNFAGLLEGNGNNITFAAGATGPFFASINSSGMVQNLGILNSTLAAVNNGRILGSYATGNRSCAAADCASGGLVDRNNGAIIDSHARGNSSCTGGCDSGGLVGTNTGPITGSYATGTSACDGAACSSGGLVGWNEGPILRSYALGDVTCSGSSDATGGGLVGLNRDKVTRSYAIGDIVCTGTVLVGGLMGAARGSVVVRQSYATGTSACMGPFCLVGGLVGTLGSTFDLIQSYAAGNSTCAASSCRSGGITGARLTIAHEITASYKAQNTGSGGIHRTLAQLRCPTMANQTCTMGTNTYVGWDEAIWDFGTANDLPTLRDLPDCPTFRPNCRH